VVVDYRKVLTLRETQRGPKAYIRHLDISVQMVLRMMADGLSNEEIIWGFPCLQKEDLLACLAYAADGHGFRNILSLLEGRS
jgi:uncharacterized protein (DUF433 family)